MPSLGFAPGFFTRYPDLPKDVQKKIPGLMAKFEASTLAGVHLEKPEAIADRRARTVRIDKFWRGVVMAPTDGDVYVLFDILPHDDAYAWCKRHTFVTNAATNAVEVVDVAAVRAVKEALTGGDGDSGSPHSPQAGIPLFSAFADSEILSLGIDDEHLASIRQVRSEADLAALTGVLAASQADALQMLAAGYSVREARAELGIGGTAREAGREGSALLASPTVFVPRDAAELRDALERPLDLWRIFLHPSQQRIAYRETYSGPVRVTGGAGTGKTVVAVHRAHYLAGRLPADSTRPVLVVTFVRTLAQELRSNLTSLAGADGYGDIDVTTVDALARRIVRRAEGEDPKVLADTGRITALWDEAAAGLPPPLTSAVLRQEWEHVILAQGLRSETEYLGAPRPGRGLRLTRAQRAMVWEALDRFLKCLVKTGERTFHQLADDAARYLSQAPTAELFAHVVVDEAQDLHPVQWRLLRAAVPDGSNDLFVVGDAHQRIYDHRVSLGIRSVRGESPMRRSRWFPSVPPSSLAV